MIIDGNVVNDLGLSPDCIGASIVFRYQKSGGQYVCPRCGTVLGTPRQKHGTIVGSDTRPSCGRCGVAAVIKFAQIITRPGTITRAIMRKQNGATVTAKVKLNKLDTYSKRLAREYAYQKLLTKCAA